MKAIKYCIMAVLAICIGACSNSSKPKVKSVKVKPETEKIMGPWGDYFEIVNKEYIINFYDDPDFNSGWEQSMDVEFKRIAEGGPEAGTLYVDDAFIKIILMDESGIKLNNSGGEVRNYSGLSSKELDELIGLRVGETLHLELRLSELPQEAVKFKFESYLKDNKSKATETNSSTEEKKIEIIPPSALKGKIEIVEDNYKVKKNKNGFPEITITFKLLNKVNTSSMVSEYNQMWIIGEGLDEKGRVVKDLMPNYNEWRTDDSEGNEFKEFLESDPGNTITMSFSGGKDGDVDSGLKQVAKFRLKLTK